MPGAPRVPKEGKWGEGARWVVCSADRLQERWVPALVSQGMSSE